MNVPLPSSSDSEDAVSLALDDFVRTGMSMTPDNPSRSESLKLAIATLMSQPFKNTSTGGTFRFVDVLKGGADANSVSEDDLSLFSARMTLVIHPDDHPDRPQLYENLAIPLLKAFERSKDVTFLLEAIDVLKEALDICPFGHPNHLVLRVFHVDSSRKYADIRGDERLMNDAIKLFKELLALELNDGIRAMLCSLLASSMKDWSHRTGNDALFDEAIGLQRELVALYPVGDPQWFKECELLVAWLVLRFEASGDDSVLDETISLGRETMRLRPADDPDRAVSCLNLSNSLRARFFRTGDRLLLDEAIDLARTAISLTTEEQSQRFLVFNWVLAAYLTMKFKQTGDIAVLEEAITRQRINVRLLPPSDRYQRAGALMNLAISLEAMFSITRDVGLLYEIIELDREALPLWPIGHPERAGSYRSLAWALMAYVRRGADVTLLQEARALCEETLDFLPIGSTVRWRTLVLLARVHLHPLHPQPNVATAITCLEQAITLDADDPPELLGGVSMVLDDFTLDQVPEEYQSTLLQVYSAGIDLAVLVAGFVLDHESQLQYISACRRLVPGALWLANAIGNLDLGLKLLERARGLIWSQLLHLRDPYLQDVPPHLASELHGLMRQLSSKSSENQVPLPGAARDLHTMERDRRHQQHARVQHIIQEVRSLPGLADFMRGPSYNSLVSVASAHPVIVLIESEIGCHALIIMPPVGSLAFLALPHSSHSDLQAFSQNSPSTQMRGSDTAYVDSPGRGVQISQSRSRSSFYRMLTKLWRAVVKPVLAHLGLTKADAQTRRRIYWCPTGAFNFVPLHAAGIYEGGVQECCSDYVVSSYAPTIAALLRAQETAATMLPETSKLLLIAAESGAHSENLPTLWNVEHEISTISSAARVAKLRVDVQYCTSGSATTSQVAAALESANLVHIACHGIQSTTAPLSSGFCLEDGRLTVQHLMDLDLKHSFLAFLSACETATGDKEQPDQTIHLAAAMLSAGFKSIVATMWAMNDADGPAIAQLFYERLFASGTIEVDTIPYTLDYAISELRKKGVPPERWATFIHVGA